MILSLSQGSSYETSGGNTTEANSKTGSSCGKKGHEKEKSYQEQEKPEKQKTQTSKEEQEQTQELENVEIRLKYGFCKKSLRKDAPLTSKTGTLL